MLNANLSLARNKNRERWCRLNEAKCVTFPSLISNEKVWLNLHYSIYKIIAWSNISKKKNSAKCEIVLDHRDWFEIYSIRYCRYRKIIFTILNGFGLGKNILSMQRKLPNYVCKIRIVIASTIRFAPFVIFPKTY